MKNFIFPFCFILLSCSPKDQKDVPVCEISLVSTVEEALHNPLFQKGNWPKENWWEGFGDEALSRVVRASLDRNPGYLAAKAQVEEIAEQAKIVYANLFPMMGLSADLLWAYLGKETAPNVGVNLPSHIHPTTIFFSLSYDFDFWGKNRQKFEAALGQVKTQEALYAQSKLMLSVSVAETYFDLQAVMEEYDLSRELLEQQQRLLELTVLQLENGITNQLSVNGIRENVVEIEKAVIVLEQEIALKKHALQVLIGNQIKENFTIERISFEEPTVTDLPSFIGSDLLARRPDIMAQIWQVRSAARLVGAAKAEFLPNINLSAGTGVFSFDFKDLFNRGAFMGFLLPSFELPIFTGGKLTANLKAQIASYQQAIQEYNSLVLSALQQVADQVATVRAFSERCLEQKTKVDLSYQDMYLTKLRVDAGIDPMTNYLQVKSRYLAEKTLLTDLRRGQVVAQIELIKALGGGYRTDGDSSLCKE